MQVRILQFPGQFIYDNNNERKVALFFLHILSLFLYAAMFVCVSTYGEVQLLICERGESANRKDRRTIAAIIAPAATVPLEFAQIGFILCAEISIWEGESRTQLLRRCTFALSPFYLTGAPISRCLLLCVIEFGVEGFFGRPSPMLQAWNAIPFVRTSLFMTCTWKSLLWDVRDCPNQSALTVVIETARRRPNTFQWRLFVKLTWFYICFKWNKNLISNDLSLSKFFFYKVE